MGDDETTVLGAEWIYYAEPDMTDVSWGDSEVGVFKAGAAVPSSCVLWGWVAHILSELAYPSKSNRPPVLPRGSGNGVGQCLAASNMLASIRP
eukprot:SAG22_NODE_13871_length_392_cov_0.962457_1_plen_92_part_01